MIRQGDSSRGSVMTIHQDGGARARGMVKIRRRRQATCSSQGGVVKSVRQEISSRVFTQTFRQQASSRDFVKRVRLENSPIEFVKRVRVLGPQRFPRNVLSTSSSLSVLLPGMFVKNLTRTPT